MNLVMEVILLPTAYSIAFYNKILVSSFLSFCFFSPAELHEAQLWDAENASKNAVICHQLIVTSLH